MADAALLNALKDLNQSLKESNRIQSRMAKVLEAMNNNYIEMNRRETDIVEPFVAAEDMVAQIHDKKVYGWSMAASVQREGGLKVGDMKIEQDDSHWVWTGDDWERTELPPIETTVEVVEDGGGPSPY